MTKRKTFLNIIPVIGPVLLILIGTIFYCIQSNSVLAIEGDETVTGGNDNAGGYGANCPANGYCTSYYAGWHKQSYEDFLQYEYDRYNDGDLRTTGWYDDGEKRAETSDRWERLKKTCSSTSHIYRLSLEAYYTNSDGKKIFVENQYSGLREVKDILNGKTGDINTYKPGSAEDWDEVYQKWLLAEAHKNELDDWNESWDTTAVFCFDDSWVDPCDEDDEFYEYNCVNPCPPTHKWYENGCKEPYTPQQNEVRAYFESNTTVAGLKKYVPTANDTLIAKDGKTKFAQFTVMDDQEVTLTFIHDILYFSDTFGSTFRKTKITNRVTENNVDYDPDKFLSESVANNTPYTIATETKITKDGKTVYQKRDESKPTKTNNYSTDDSGENVYKDDIKVTVAEGETVRICSKVKYNQKYAKITWKEELVKSSQYRLEQEADGTPKIDGEGHTIWTKTANAIYRRDFTTDEYTDDGFSKICVTIYHPETPTSITTNVGTPYTEEDVPLDWNYTVKSGNPTLFKYVRRETIGYTIEPEPKRNDRFYTGTNTWILDGDRPCTHYKNKGSPAYVKNCHNFTNDTTIQPAGETYSKRLYGKVPNSVGQKYCTSGGYTAEAYAIIDKVVQFQGTYRIVFNASCRTIRKKPNLSVWNGGVFTTGNITTSLSNRFDSVSFGELSGGDRTFYGSWNEYLTAAGGIVSDGTSYAFSSGSILNGGKKTSSITNLYPLTISNTTSTPGHSGISQNQTLQTRLETYLKNRANATLANSNSITGLTVNNTQIYNINGNLEISGNIITDTSKTYSSIYDIPQAIIFVNGDVTITSDVQRIDAWIIATGNINTCKDFSYGTTDSDASGEHSSRACTNQLIINGPVMASSLTLNRSYGSDSNGNTGYSYNGTTGSSSASASAEVFNLRADTYLWAYAQSSRYQSSFTETYSRELAPRY